MLSRLGDRDQPSQEKDDNAGCREAVAVRWKLYTWLSLVMLESRGQLATLLKHKSPFSPATAGCLREISSYHYHHLFLNQDDIA
jgi:hypothetical protein